MKTNFKTLVAIRSGDSVDEITLRQFVMDNADGLTLQDIANIGDTLDRGEVWHGGGGAAGAYTVERASSPSIDEPDREEMKAALEFIVGLADEELGHVKVGTGAEVALRHIMRRANEALRQAGGGS